jgi:flagellar basal-body rod protein FlgC
VNVLNAHTKNAFPVFTILADVLLKPGGGNMKRPSLWLAALAFLFVMCQGQESVHGRESEKYYTMLEGQVKDTAFVKFLRDRGVKLETDANGLLRIYVRGTPETIPAIVKFLGLMKTRMEVSVENLVNVDTTQDASGKANPYRRKIFSIDKNGNASVVIDETTPSILRYIPGHRNADEKGFVAFPGVSATTEIMDLNEAQLEYSIAENLLERCLPGNYIPVYSVQLLKLNAQHFVEIGVNRDRLDRIELKLDGLKPAR